MAERRTLPRKMLMYYLRVFDRKNGRQLGFMVDITVTGLKVNSEQPLMTGAIYQLQIELPQELFPQQKFIEVRARSIWCDKDISPIYYNTGYELLDVQDEQVGIIDTIVQAYSFKRGEMSPPPDDIPRR